MCSETGLGICYRFLIIYINPNEIKLDRSFIVQGLDPKCINLRCALIPNLTGDGVWMEVQVKVDVLQWKSRRYA